MPSTILRLILVANLLTLAWAVRAQAATQIDQLNSAALWQRLEFRIVNVPSVANPFDPDLIKVDAEFNLPSGKILTVPAFWYQGYQRGLSSGSEYVNLSGPAEWRVRFTPTEVGLYSVSLTIRTNGQPSPSAAPLNFTVPVSMAPPTTGYVRVAAGKQYFETSQGDPLLLVGANVCWPGARGTYDYDDWFAAMHAAGENYARIWMCPWAFGLETESNSLVRYRLEPAWKLDQIFQQAEQRGIRLLLCLDYHGMFEVQPDYWGGNNFWPKNPYNVTNAGPCLNQNAFFTNPGARTIYQKRLRYLVARYGYSPSLAAWQFFNEIDNVYAYLNPSDVAAWHAVMGHWIRTNDPFAHLVTTSLTGSSDRPEIWTLPQMDFASYHSYAEPGPTRRLATVAQSFLQRYGKPVLIAEFGTDWRGWNRENDPYLRGFRQGLWGGALGGSAGSALSWWWENIHAENVYPTYQALGAILKRTGWGRGAWTNIGFKTFGGPPATVGDVIPGGQPFDVFLGLSGAWGAMPSGQLPVPNTDAAGFSAATLNAFVHGIWHSDLKVPFRLSAWLTNNARLIMHLNSVSSGSILAVRVDGAEIFRTNLPNPDGGYQVNNEYNLDLSVALPSGKRLIEVTNAGTDWFYLDWVRLERVLPAAYDANWQPSPESIGLRGSRESLLYVVAPGVAFPGNATNTPLLVQSGLTITLTNWPSGTHYAEWYDPASAAHLGYSQAISTNGQLVLTLPDFDEDLAGVVYAPPRLTTLGANEAGDFQFQLVSETGGQYHFETSSDLSIWNPFLTVTNVHGITNLTAYQASTAARAFFRAKQKR
jgi:hypothetical protein